MNTQSLKSARAFLMVCAGVLVFTAIGTAQTIEDEKKALSEAKVQAELAEKRANELELKSESAENEADALQAKAAAVAARIQAAEADITTSEARIKLIDNMRNEQRARLATMQEPAVKLVAALQMMGRRPPALVLMQPGSTTNIVHVRAVLEGMMPQIEKRTAGIKKEIGEGRRLREDAEKALAVLTINKKKLADSKIELAKLEGQYRAQSQQYRTGALTEQDKAIALGERARDIVDLIDRLGADSATRNTLMSLPGPTLRPTNPGESNDAPAEIPGSRFTLGNYRLPVTGTLVAGLGEVSDTGVRARGLTLIPRPDAQVVAPASGSVVFAGDFKGYGKIVIIDHGGSWTSLITNMDSISVRVGDKLVENAPIGKAANSQPRIMVELRKGNQPVDITPNLS
jgi:murein hydrolase activator